MSSCVRQRSGEKTSPDNERLQSSGEPNSVFGVLHKVCIEVCQTAYRFSSKLEVDDMQSSLGAVTEELGNT